MPVEIEKGAEGHSTRLMYMLFDRSTYDPTVVAGFEDALKMLKAEAFDVVVAAERLGTHNGLHLAIRARTERPVVAIVTCTDPDRLLEIDARELGATCLVAPWLNPADFLAVIGRLTGAAHV